MNSYRFAAPAHVIWNLLKSILFVAIYWGLLLIAIPLEIARVTSKSQEFGLFVLEPLPILAYVVFAGSFLIGIWALFTVAITGSGTPMPFDAPRRLVIHGPYAWMRNPLLMAGLGQGIAVALYTGALPIIAWVVGVIATSQYLVWSSETSMLERTFGRDFEAYRRSVRYWLPMRRRWKPVSRDSRPISLDEIELNPRRHMSE